MSRISGAHHCGFVPGPTFKVAAVASRCQRVGDLIGSGFETYTFRTRGRRLATCAIWPVAPITVEYKCVVVVKQSSLATFKYCSPGENGFKTSLRFVQSSLLNFFYSFFSFSKQVLSLLQSVI